MPFGGWTPFPRRYTRVLLGVAAATKTIVGVFKQQWETLSSVAEGERGKVKWSPGMNTTSVIPCALQRLMAAVWLKKNLKPLVIPGASFGCSSGFQRWTSWAPPMLERGLPSPVVRPGRGHGWQGLPSDASRPGSLAALHVPSRLSLSHTVCVSPVLSTQLASLATRKATSKGPRGRLLFLASREAKPGGVGDSTLPLQAGWGVASSLPMWRFSSLPGGKVFFCSMMDALGPAHYCQTIQGSLQVSAVLLIEEREEVGASPLFMCIKTLSGSSPITGVICNGVSQSSWQGGTSPCLCVPPLPPTALAESGTVVVLVATTSFGLQFSIRWSLGVLLGRPMPSWFLWAHHLQESPHRLGRAGFLVMVLGSILLGSSGGWGPFLTGKTPHPFLRGLGLCF